MALREEILKRAEALQIVPEEVLDIVTQTFVGITFDKVFYKKDRLVKSFVNRQEVSGFNVSLEGKSKKDLLIVISKTVS